MQQQYQQQQQQFAQAPQYNQQSNASPMMFAPTASTTDTVATTPIANTNANTNANTSANTNAPNTNAPSTPNAPVESIYAASSNKHIFKRLPEENFQNQEVKGRLVLFSFRIIAKVIWRHN
jgi:hypothetical protein